MLEDTRGDGKPAGDSVDHNLLPLDCQIQRNVADLTIRYERSVIY